MLNPVSIKSLGAYFLNIILACSLLISGCASSTTITSQTTGNTRKVNIDKSYKILVAEPSTKNPELIFRLVRVDMYRHQKQRKYETIQEKEVNGLGTLVLLPFATAGVILSLGEFNLYDELKSEEVMKSEKKWEIDSKRSNLIIEESLDGIPVKMTYSYLDKKTVVKGKTDSNGQFRKDISKLARSVTLDPNAEESVTFRITGMAPCNCEGEFTISPDKLIEIYEKLVADGKFRH